MKLNELKMKLIDGNIDLNNFDYGNNDLNEFLKNDSLIQKKIGRVSRLVKKL